MQQDKKFLYAFLILGTVLFILRLPTLLELPTVDQAFFAYLGQKMHQGQLLYRDLWDHKSPGIFFLYNWMAWEGNIQPWIIPLADMLFTLLTLGGIFLLARSWGSPLAAWGAAFVFALCSLSAPFSRAWARNQAEMLMNLPMILSIYTAYLGFHRQKKWLWLLAGLAWGIALVIKFTALFLALPLIPLLVAAPPDHKSPATFRLKNLFYFCLGGAVPLIATFMYLLAKGVLPQAYEALVVFNGVYAARRVELKTLPAILSYNFKGQIIFISVVLLLTLGELARRKIYYSLRGQILFCWLLAAILSIGIQGKYFEPHFLILIPPLSLLAGSAFEAINPKATGKKTVVISLTVVLLLAGATGDVLRDYLHAYKSAWNFFSSSTTYTQALVSIPANRNKLGLRDLGKNLARHTQEKDFIYVWGPAAPEIYYFSGRSAPNRFILHYYLMDAQNPLSANFPGVEARRQELLNDLKTKPPKFFLVGLKDTNIFERKDPLSQLRDFSELELWLKENYFPAAHQEQYLIWQRKE